MSDSQNNQWTETIESHHSLFDLNLKEVWRYRDLAYMFVKRDFVSSFKQTILGPVWFFINPIFTTIVYIVVFGNIANLSTDNAPKIPFYLAGITLWNYFSSCLSATSNVFTANASIFGKVYFPRLIMPISIVLSNLMRFGVQMVLFLIVFFYYLFKGEIQPNWWILATPFLIILMAVFALGMGMIFSSLTTKYRDLQMLLTFGISLYMYATPVIYPNPATSKVFINYPQTISVAITGMDGKLMMVRADVKEVDIHDLAAGTYIIAVYDEAGHKLLAQQLIKN